MTSDRHISPVFHVILLAVSIRNETATCNCLIEVLSKGYSRHESDVEKQWEHLWEYCVKTYMKNFATSPCYRVVITYVCLGACTLILHLINSELFFNRLFPLYMNWFRVFDLDTSSTFFYLNYMVDILLRCSKLLLE